jgi:protein-S-isoprenylcysteine O-methyltransferase Ste14
MTSTRSPWWKGTRGEWYFAVQLVLFSLIAFGPRTPPGWPAWTFPPAGAGRFLGALLGAAGALLAGSAVVRLRRHLSPLPHPVSGAPLHERGPYRIVRHPMYGGAILAAFGAALWTRGWLNLLYAALLVVFFDLKARREERRLQSEYPSYPAYRSRVRKLIPFVY